MCVRMMLSTGISAQAGRSRQMERLSIMMCLLGVLSAVNGFFLAPATCTSPLMDRRQKTVKVPPVNVLGSLFPSPATSSSSTRNAKAQELKASILRLSSGKDNGIKASQEEKDKIVALAQELGKLNQVKSIARSTASDGLWRLVFTTTTGSSSGKLGPFVGEVLQDIECSAKQYVNIVRILGGAVEGSLVAKWEVLGANEWKVIFDTITFKVLGIPLVDKKPLGGQAGVWRMTYVDDDLRILWAAGMTNQGKPARVENIYILKKQQ